MEEKSATCEADGCSNPKWSSHNRAKYCSTCTSDIKQERYRRYLDNPERLDAIIKNLTGDLDRAA